MKGSRIKLNGKGVDDDQKLVNLQAEIEVSLKLFMILTFYMFRMPIRKFSFWNKQWPL